MKVRRLFRRLSKHAPVRACYEASGAGFVLHRVLADDGFHCDVIAPSLIPRKPGDHRKTDRLDPVMLARLYRSGHLPPVHVPSQQLRQKLEGPLQTALAAELEHLEYVDMQRGAFDAEIDDIHRFRSPRALMAYFGLLPMECSSGERERRGPITKAGNIHARRLLVEAAWNNRHNAGADLILNRRRQGQPAEVVAIALKAQHRLLRKFRRLDQRKHRHVAIAAVARELCGFVWAILNSVPQH